MTTTTPLMRLVLPTPSDTTGPQWATLLNAAMAIIDEHDHGNGKGSKVTPSGLNIITELSFQGSDAIQLRSVRFSDQSATFSNAADVRAMYVVNGDLYYVNDEGDSVQITSGAGLSFSSLGTIGGDFGQPGVAATATYSNLTKTFSWLRAAGEAADLYASGLSLGFPQAGALAVKIISDVNTIAYTLVMPAAAPTDNSVLSFDSSGVGTFRSILGTAGETTVSSSASAHTVGLPNTITKQVTISGNNTHSGNNSFTGTNTFSAGTTGCGIVPLGAVLPTFAGLTGAYACVATTAADANGFVQCAGQTIADATSPMNGAVIPNINNNVFLMGNVASGTAGGSNTKTLTSTELPAHVHGMGHGHGNSFALTGTTSFASTAHTHDHSHSHQWTARFRTDANVTTDYSVTSPNSSLSTWSTTGTGVGTVASLGASTYSGSLFQYTYAPNPLPIPVGSGVNRNYTGGPIDNSGNLVSNTGGPSATGSVGLTGAVTDYEGVTTSAGSGSAFDIRPSYISARFIIRVK